MTGTRGTRDAVEPGSGLAWAPLRRHWPAVLIAAVLAGAAAYGLSTLGPTRYESVSTLLVYETVEAGSVSSSDLETSARLAAMFSRLASFDPVLEAAVDLGDLPLTSEELRRSSSVQPVADTPLLEVQAVSTDPRLAQRAAGALAEAIIVSNEEGGRVQEGTISIVQPAGAGVRTTEPFVNAALGGVLGALVVLTALYLADAGVWSLGRRRVDRA
jgi:capsular polysaccharide biosynthesis protein